MPEPDDVTGPAGPYARSAPDYFRAGWAPVPIVGKWPPPTGWTGREGQWPSYPDVQTWCEYRGGDNVGLRLPDGVLGIDVDQYGDKHGAATLATCEEKWGPLPPTWISSSREDGGVSGIRYFRVPKGLAWPGGLPGGDVDLILWSHRYAVVAPSVHPEGREYFWRDPDESDSRAGELPRPSELPLLPSGWVVGLVRGQFKDAPSIEVDAHSWLAQLPGAHQPMCERMATVAQEALGVLAGGSRHDALCECSMRIIRNGERGHEGTLAALGALRTEFLSAVTGDGTRSVPAAEGEWSRALDGAVSRIEGSRTPRQTTGDPCARVPTSPLRTALDAIGGAPSVAGSAEPAGDGGTGWDWGELDEEPEDDWAPAPWGPVLAGEVTGLIPTGLARTDGALLLYPGRVNGIIGPAESGKSWLALEALRQIVKAGGRALIIDFEDYQIGLAERLRCLGLSDEEIAGSTRYIRPESPLTDAASARLANTIRTFDPTLIILDGVNAAMTLLNYDLISNKDSTRFYTIMLSPLADTGAIVLYVDHTVKKDPEGGSPGAIGAQAKRAMTTGSTIRVDVMQPFAMGMTGQLQLTVDKDRPGRVRAASAGAKRIGTARLASNTLTGRVTIEIEPAGKDAPSLRNDDDGVDWLPTVTTRKVAEYLQLEVEDRTQNAIRIAIKARNTYVVGALQYLVDHELVIMKETLKGRLYGWNHGQAGGRSGVVPDVPGTGAGPRVGVPVAGEVPLGASQPGTSTRQTKEDHLEEDVPERERLDDDERVEDE